MRIVALSGAQSLQHPTFGAAQAGADGVFDLPAEFAGELVKQRGQFITEGEHLANQVKVSLEDFADPHKIPHALHGLRERIAAIEARLGIGAATDTAAAEVPAAVAEVKKLTARQAKAQAKADAEAAAATVTEPPAGTPLTDAELAHAAEHDALPDPGTNPPSDAEPDAAPTTEDTAAPTA